MSGQIHQDIDPVLSDELCHLLIRHAEDESPRVRQRLQLLRYRVAGGRARLTEDTMKLVLANRLSASTAVVVVDAKGVGEGNKTIRSQEGQ